MMLLYLAAIVALTLFATPTTSQTPPTGRYPYPFVNNVSSCDIVTTLLPPFSSYHVHVSFNGSDYNESLAAVNLHASFISFYNEFLLNSSSSSYAAMSECPFAHPQGYNPGFDVVCWFPFNSTMAAFPFPNNDPIFGIENYAFYIPNIPSLYLTVVTWFQHNHGSLSYLFHANSGCEANDHTKWALFGFDYKFGEVNIPALMCCQYGPPPMCYCNITMYQVNISDANSTQSQLQMELNGMYLTVSDGSDQLVLQSGDSSARRDLEKFGEVGSNLGQNTDFSLQWRETLYTWDFPQIENFGQPMSHSYRCIGILQDDAANGLNGLQSDVCAKGAKVGVIDCYQEDLLTNLFAFDFEYSAIRAYNCTKQDLCIKLQVNDEKAKSVSNETYSWVLDDCAQSTKIIRYDLA